MGSAGDWSRLRISEKESEPFVVVVVVVVAGATDEVVADVDAEEEGAGTEASVLETEGDVARDGEGWGAARDEAARPERSEERALGGPASDEGGGAELDLSESRILFAKTGGSRGSAAQQGGSEREGRVGRGPTRSTG